MLINPSTHQPINPYTHTTINSMNISHQSNSLRWHLDRLRQLAMRRVYPRLYRDRHPDIADSILVAGTARSGTTWLADLIASQLSCRMMFEPFNPELVLDFHGFHYFHYQRPEQENLALQHYCEKIFRGRIRHPWIDREVDQLRPRYRLIKEIRANLFLRWINLHFPQLPLLFIIRHPCAVVQSRLQLNWATDSDIAPFLAQEDLREDFLKDKLMIIQQAKTAEEKHAVIWCISNLVPLRQFPPGSLQVVFYENLCVQPEIEIPAIFAAIGQPYDDSVFRYANRPSGTSRANSAVVTGKNRVDGWRQKLTPEQIKRILAIVDAFGLSDLYRDVDI